MTLAEELIVYIRRPQRFALCCVPPFLPRLLAVSKGGRVYYAFSQIIRKQAYNYDFSQS